MDPAEMLETLEVELTRGRAAFEAADTLEQLEEAQVSVLGRKAAFSQLQRNLGSLDEEQRRVVGARVNAVRAELTESLEARRAALREAAEATLLEADRIDLSLPGRRPRAGSLHPLTLVERDVIEVFTRLGFRVAEGPEIEDDWHNFQALNIPVDHPARTMKDSLFVAIPGHPELLLRTETSAVQIRTMQSQPPPVYVIAPGRVYRRETADATHLAVFHQVEGLVVDEGITFADLKGTLEAMAKELFGASRRVRLGPAYFPFVEPGAEVGVSCFLCDGVGCRVCGNGWIELLGAGMVHPTVLENCGYDAERYTGFAFGVGIERIALLRYAIPDIRMLVDGDVRFLEQFGDGVVRIPLAWLREYAPTDMPADDLADLITHRGVKVEGVLYPWEGLEGVMVARVLEVRDHPNSEKLCLARLQHAAGEIELVVGVRNMKAGDLVPWAPPGARVPVLEEPLGQREIRGVVSHGMLCSPRELAISTDHGGILVLNDEGMDVGTDLKLALELDQPVLDIEVEPNRPDFLSILGVAREVAAATGVSLRPVEHTVAEGAEDAASVVSVRIDAPAACPRYLARVVRGVTHRATPLWAQARLTACGMRPIDAVVDATNYTMLELGQPLHGFDLAALAGPGIVVRHATDGEHITTLDEIDRELVAADLLICDLDRPVAIAGVMGGQAAEVSATTSDVLLESASFVRGGVLLTARRLDLHSEASHRFERGTDPEGLELAADRCAALMTAWAGGEVAREYAGAGATPARHWVSVRPSRAAALLGYPVEAADAALVFDTLGMAHRAASEAIEVEVPGYRTDIDHEVDLIEEIVRIQGYDRVGSTLPRAPHPGGLPDDTAFAARAKDALVRAGLREIRPVPFVSQEDLDLFGDDDAVPVANPLRAEEGFLRTRLSPGLLHGAARNLARGVAQVALFEVGTTFRLASPFSEHRKLGFVLSGPVGDGWFSERRPFDVLDATGILEAVLADLGVGAWAFGEPPGRPFHPGRSATVTIAGRHAGVIGEIHPRVAASLEIDGRVAVCVLGLGPLREGIEPRGGVGDIPRFPPVRRDLAFVVPIDVPAGSVERTLRDAGGDRLRRCHLFDVFAGPPLAEGTRSLAYALELREHDRTLTDEEAQSVVDRMVAAVTATFGASLRAG